MDPRGLSAVGAPFDTQCGFVDLTSHVARLTISGTDARDYLQRTVSSDLTKLSPSELQRSTLLTPKGKMIAAFEIGAIAPDSFVLVVPRAACDDAVTAIERFVILEDVSVAVDAQQLWTVQGAGVAEVVTAAFPQLFNEATSPAEPLAFTGDPTEGPWIVAHDRCGNGGYDVWVSAERSADVAQALDAAGASAVAQDTLEHARITAGIPRFGIDATSDNFPPESGWSDAISYDKGCYTGQEVVARIRTYGHVNKQLRRLHVTELPNDEAPTPGAEIYGTPSDGAEPKVVGKITSITPASDSTAVALGYVRNQCAEAGTVVTVRWGEHAAQATVAGLAGE